MNIPRHITKYFKPEDRKYYENGMIRFGNLVEYRRAEEEMTLGARGDRNEGTTVTVDPIRPAGMPDPSDSSNWAEWNAYFEKRRAFDRSLSPNMSVHRNVFTTTMNAWVFCASIGAYDANHHELMLGGDETTGCRGNPDLRSWCTFDTRKLIRAAKSALRWHENFSRSMEYPEVIYWREVEYDWSVNESDNGAEFLEAMFGGHKALSDDEVVRLLTTKRPMFSTEKEFRLIARIDDRSSLPNDEPPLFIDSLRIRNSIVEFGELK